VEGIPRFILTKLYHRANIRRKYAAGFYNSIMNDRDGHIPLPQIMFTCTMLRVALLEWQTNEGVHSKSSKSKLTAERPDHWKNFDHQNSSGKIACCFCMTGRKLLTLPGVAVTYTLLMNTWNKLQESYQQRVYNNTLETVRD
jgi:hypothetical protein